MKPLYNAIGQMRVAGFMSGSGTNLRKIIEHEKACISWAGKSPYTVAVIFSDTCDSKATTIGRDYDLPVITRDIRSYYKARGKPRRDMLIRADFDSETIDALRPYDIDVVAYAGYMSIASAELVERFLGVNVHPADLRIMSGGKRKYTGDHAVRDAILAGETEIRASTHIAEPVVDGGRLLMISAPVAVTQDDSIRQLEGSSLDTLVGAYQNVLKEKGDWVIFPKTLEYLAERKFMEDNQGNLYCCRLSIPNGLEEA